MLWHDHAIENGPGGRAGRHCGSPACQRSYPAHMGSGPWYGSGGAHHDDRRAGARGRRRRRNGALLSAPRPDRGARAQRRLGLAGGIRALLARVMCGGWLHPLGPRRRFTLEEIGELLALDATEDRDRGTPNLATSSWLRFDDKIAELGPLADALKRLAYACDSSATAPARSSTRSAGCLMEASSIIRAGI